MPSLHKSKLDKLQSKLKVLHDLGFTSSDLVKIVYERLEDCDGLFDCALLMIEKKNPNPDTLEDCDSPART
ncbi:hypothetical protein L1887_20162 [Cichorium endivia]|nr:hypothetical protein L1887_20162 [Cichorium endivia]